MSHYHPASYEAEARIRQSNKLQYARQHRQLQAARASRPQTPPGPSFLARIVARLVTALEGPKMKRAPSRSPGPSH